MEIFGAHIVPSGTSFDWSVNSIWRPIIMLDAKSCFPSSVDVTDLFQTAQEFKNWDVMNSQR